MERAERSRAPIEKIADRLAGYLVYFALACAALTFWITRDARSTISVIVVAGACGIAAGTPLAILGAIGRAAQKGVIIKGGRYLEGLSNVDIVVLDKTGTLTLGTPEVVERASGGGRQPRRGGPHRGVRRALFRASAGQGDRQESQGVVATGCRAGRLSIFPGQRHRVPGRWRAHRLSEPVR